MNDVERIDREELSVSRRELMAGSSVVAGAAVAGVMPRKVAAQQDPDNEISGTVTDAAGAVDGATVVAVPHDSSLDPLVTTTDSNGDYIFNESALYTGDNLYHVIARDGTEASPRRGQENYPFLMANGGADIPDSGGLHARYDATALSLSDQDSVTTWADETGNGHDLTAGTAPTYIDSGINGNPVVRFDGADDFLSGAFGSTEGQPTHIFVVAEYRSTSTSNEAVFDGDSTRQTIANGGGGDYGYYAGDFFTETGVTAAGTYLFSTLFDGGSSYQRLNGSQEASGDAGSHGLDGVTLGASAGGGEHGPVDIGEVLVYSEAKSSSEGEIEQYLSDKWGITL